MSEKEASKLNIIKVFKLPGRTNIDTLFVEFTNKADLKKIRSLAGNMDQGGSNEPRLVNFIPKMLQKEYESVVQRANEGRAKSPKNASKIWITTKFELRLRPKGSFTPWNRIQPEDLDDHFAGAIPKVPIPM